MASVYRYPCQSCKQQRKLTGDDNITCPKCPFRAQYRDATGKQRTRHFKKERDAKAWLTTVEASILKGDYVDPRAGKVPFSTFADDWIAKRHVKHSTKVFYLKHLKNNAKPYFGEMRLNEIKAVHVQEFVNWLVRTRKLMPNTVHGALKTLTAVMSAAVRLEVIPKSPVQRIEMPKIEAPDIECSLDADKVQALVEASPAHYKAMVELLANTGLRYSECAGLAIRHFDFFARTVRVERQLLLAGDPDGPFGPPKSESSKRTVPLTDSMVFTISEHIKRFVKDPTDRESLVFTTKTGNPAHYNTYETGTWRTTRKRAGCPEVKIHDFRKFYATTLVYNLVAPKDAQVLLGHDSFDITMRYYAKVMSGGFDRVREVLEATFAVHEKSTQSTKSPQNKQHETEIRKLGG